MKEPIRIPKQQKDMIADVAAVILIGGESRRFGTDKSQAKLCGLPIESRMVRTLKEITPNVYLSGRESTTNRHPDVPFLADKIAGIGPVAGLDSALQNNLAPWILLVACDLPLITPDVLQSLINSRSAACQAVVPVTPDGRRHPVCALYHRSVAPIVTDNIRSHRYALHQLLGRIQFCELPVPAEPLTNMNTVDDLARIERTVSEKEF